MRGYACAFLLASMLPFTAAADFEIRGQIVDENGTPLPSAEVVCLDRHHGPVVLNRITTSLVGLQEVLQTQCDDEGRFSLSFHESLFPFCLRATAPGLGYGVVDFRLDKECPTVRRRRPEFLPEEPYAEPLVIRLPPSFTYHGRVVDESGLPVEGAAVHFSDFQQPVFSSDDGSFVIEKVPVSPEGRPGVALSHPDYANRWTSDLPDAAITLDPGAVVSGRVMSVSGIGIPGVVVSVGQAFANQWAAWLGGTVTDEQGRYETRVRSGKTLAVSLRESGPEPDLYYGMPEWHVLKAETGETVGNLDFVMQRGTTLYGRVLDKATGQPLAGYYLRAIYSGERLDNGSGGMSFSDGGDAITDDQGRYHIVGLRPERHRIWTYAKRGDQKPRLRESLEISASKPAMEHDILLD